jgi:hypothetical protein
VIRKGEDDGRYLTIETLEVEPTLWLALPKAKVVGVLGSVT